MPYYKTTITVEILSDHVIGEPSLDDISREITEGDWSGKCSVTKVQQLSTKQLIKECEDHHTDPAFFGLESN